MAHRPETSTPLLDLLAFLANAYPDTGQCFQYGLSLLARSLDMDRAMLALLTPYGLETAVWATPEGVSGTDWTPSSATGFCHVAMRTAPSSFVVENATQDSRLAEYPECLELGIQAYLGIPLGEPPLGVLSLQSANPRAFTKFEHLFASGIASYFARLLEAEQLKEELRQKDEVLALQRAVADDHALEHPHSQLPTRRYLDIWVRANLSRARRSGGKIGVAIFDSRSIPQGASDLTELALHLRGEDLLADLGNHQILIAAPESNHGLMEGLLKRISNLLGFVPPMGVTLWDPERDIEGGQPNLAPAIERARQALMESLGSTPAGIMWKLHEAREDGHSR